MPASRLTSNVSRRTAMRLGTSGLVAALSQSRRNPVVAQASSTTATNKAVIRRVFEELLNRGNTAVIDEVYAPVFVDLSRAARHTPRPACLPVPLADFHAVFPDIVAVIEDIIAEGDLVATRVTWRNEHPPAGTHIEGRTMHLSRVVNERIVDEWSAGWDWLDHSLVQFFPRQKAPLGN